MIAPPMDEIWDQFGVTYEITRRRLCSSRLSPNGNAGAVTMRIGLIIRLVIGAVASVAMCASYGWDQATALKDQVVGAFVFGFVSIHVAIRHPQCSCPRSLVHAHDWYPVECSHGEDCAPVTA